MQIWQTWQIWQIWQIRQSGIGGPSERRDPRRCCVTVRSRYKKGIILRDIVGIVRMCVSNGMYAVRRVGGWRGLGLILIRQSQTGINVLYEVLYCTIRDGQHDEPTSRIALQVGGRYFIIYHCILPSCHLASCSQCSEFSHFRTKGSVDILKCRYRSSVCGYWNPYRYRYRYRAILLSIVSGCMDWSTGQFMFRPPCFSAIQVQYWQLWHSIRHGMVWRGWHEMWERGVK